MGWQDRDYHRKRPEDDEPYESTSYTGDVPAGYRNGDDDDVEENVYSAEGHYGLHPEGPDPSDLRHDNEPGFVACPNCRKMIHEDAERCPKCGHYVMDEDLERSRPTWVWIGLGIALLIAITWAIFG